MLIVVRHGRTRANASGLLQGRADVENVNGLDETGLLQARRIAEALAAAAERPSRIVSSPLGRARQTAAATAELLAERGGGSPGQAGVEVEIEIDERWVELDYGEWDGVPVADIPADAWRQWRADPQFAPPGGESLAALNERVSAACEDLARAVAESEPGASVAVFTHVSPIKAAVRWALGVSEELSWRMNVAQAQITRIGFRAGTSAPVPALIAFNDTSHLLAP